jgi:cytochrome c biogenesis protein CcdA
MTKASARVVCVAMAASFAAASTVGAQLRPPRAELAPLLESSGVRAGSVIRAAVEVQLPEGLHVNSNKPRDPSLIPIKLSVEPPPGVSVLEIVYPEPIDLKQEGAVQPLAVFEREFAIGVRLRIGSELQPGEIAVPARLRYQACDEKVCYFPTTAATEWTLAVVPATAAVATRNADVFGTIAFGHGEAPVPDAGVEPLTREPVSEVLGSVANASTDGLAELDSFAVLGSTGGYIGKDDFVQFIRNAEQGVGKDEGLAGRGALAILLIVLVGGLALNLTPCVLPMIPINLAIIGAGTQAGSRRRGFLLGSAYGGAMAAVYGILGLVVVLTASTFGGINASPWFNFGIAALFVALALAMFDVFSIDFSRFSSRVDVGRTDRRTLVVAFTMGAVAALLAGACIAPVVIQVVLFSSSMYAAGTTSALALPFLLGLGMALPWPIVGAGLGRLPKPGPWMVRVKQAFGVVILVTAVYYGYLGFTLVADRWVDADEVQASVQEKLKEGWHASLAEGLAVAQREQKPVLIDLWATWCKNCLTMDKTTLRDQAVVDALSGFVKIKYRAENPDESPAKDVMQRFGAIGLPTYVVIRPKT